MGEEQERWDQRYLSEECLLGERPSRLLAEWIDELKRLCPGRRALDIACGEGRNSIFLARHGFAVTGLDISPVGLDKARRWAAREKLSVDFRLTDLEGYRITGTYDLIINFNFLLRDLIPHEVASLAPGGMLIFDTILQSPTAPVPHKKEYLLQPGELERLFAPFPGTVLYSAEFPDDATPTAKLIFRNTPDAQADR
ncbi:methyltransferase domain-containing protein [Geobacter sulfurreducens]|uniref:SAM-dependent methyltransferase n=1 Tax=Geobacter sulfurreducens (strain ATCC 51573 / DSM 12127 / PCA) TaxID=243231 RepID=Q74FD0_GEOSL|nr:methyltransferase domain-containing protein [Geobacter sulfurreducens]AAR34009.1 SAM-dependent methyltransferase [Geobacter sulfurreducens PCA]AJY70426.1 SAM-dependent methyltransferase [Geobacter sulfurreducens]UAC04742.1 methyltransferase domain-containing protein [Geobacter sulfurreducens]HBB68556.1 SAM-dependent methyltransferase [Geobacter sulfurreducens]HCD96562.1 SAM-dependent methyltransferase [Geobacter sulfurreducens]